MNLQDMMNSINQMGAKIRAQASKLADMATQGQAMDAIQGAQQELESMQAQMRAMQAAYDVERQAQAGQVVPMGTPAQQPKTRRDLLKSNEYARAFAWAMAHGVTPMTAGMHQETRILMDALTEGGGNPAGTDGGFLVPEDIDHMIREKRRELSPLANLFGQEDVTAPTGWRVVDTAPTTGMTQVNEMGTIPTDDQPAFGKVTYECHKHALILPVSNELLQDEVANLFDYLAKWYAKKLVITENNLLIAALRTTLSTATDISTDPLKGIKKAVNDTLDPAIADLSAFIMNTAAFGVLDELLDSNDRPMLQPDPTRATGRMLLGLPVNRVSKATLANVTADNATSSDIFVGYGQDFATLFRVQGFQLASTAIGGNAWRSDSTELRGIVRMGVSVFDAAAMTRLSVGIA